ncbi:hypothetical protein C8R43DRAFT_675838 [Mycena crocata]|nr:hypothetical protein C8R43DRAFT_675838 [Mycena crocata]
MHSILSPMSSTPQPESLNDTQAHRDALRASVAHLLSRAREYPCSAATPAFARIAMAQRAEGGGGGVVGTFQLALDTLLPVLDPPGGCELTARILTAFLLFALYAPHPIVINPFRSVLFVTFCRERERAAALTSNSNTSTNNNNGLNNGTGGVGGAPAPNEPLVWVLWKILKGDGDDIGPYSPAALARSLLPPNLRATKLVLDVELDGGGSVYGLDGLSPAPSSALTLTHGSNVNAPTLGTKTESDTTAAAATSDAQNAADARAEWLAHAMRLVLAGRSRVLSLAEMRPLPALLPLLAAARPPLLAPAADLPPLVAHNPGLAAGVVGVLLVGGGTPHEADIELQPHDMDVLRKAVESLRGSDAIEVADATALALDAFPATSSTIRPAQVQHTQHDLRTATLVALARLPPTLPTLDVLGRLLRDGRRVEIGDTPSGFSKGDDDHNQEYLTISALIRAAVLGPFVAGSIAALERAEEQAGMSMAGGGEGDVGGGGGVGGDGWERGVGRLCRFYTALIKAGLVDPASDADSAAMAHFSLRHARFEDAMGLYRLLVGARGEV